MKRITITVDTNEHAAELEELLNRLNYVISVEDEIAPKNLSAEEESFVSERLEYYNKNKSNALTIEQFEMELKNPQSFSH